VRTVVQAVPHADTRAAFASPLCEGERRVNAPEIEMIDLRGRTNLSKGYAAVFATVVIWSMRRFFNIT